MEETAIAKLTKALENLAEENPELGAEIQRLAEEFMEGETAYIGDTTTNQSTTPEPQETVLQRMGGMPKHLLADGSLSDRDNRRQIINEHLGVNLQTPSQRENNQK